MWRYFNVRRCRTTKEDNMGPSMHICSFFIAIEPLTRRKSRLLALVFSNQRHRGGITELTLACRPNLPSLFWECIPSWTSCSPLSAEASLRESRRLLARKPRSSLRLSLGRTKRFEVLDVSQILSGYFGVVAAVTDCCIFMSCPF